MKSILLIVLSVLISSTIDAQEKVEVSKVKAGHRTVYTEIIINASPTQVWEVLTDFESYDNWAVFFKGMTGEIKDKGKVIATFQLNPKRKKISDIDHTISYEEGRSFGWSEKAIIGIIDNHMFIVEDAGNGKTRFIQSDEFQKGGTWILGGFISKTIGRKRYPLFNRSLKSEAEKRF
jgi:hypothetical protein